MAAALTPSPVAVQATAARGFERDIKGWGMALDRGEARLDPWAVRNLERVAGLEPRAPGEVAGDTLLHFDTRATTS